MVKVLNVEKYGRKYIMIAQTGAGSSERPTLCSDQRSMGPLFNVCVNGLLVGSNHLSRIARYDAQVLECRIS